jgi:hypothetical protein
MSRRIDTGEVDPKNLDGEALYLGKKGGDDYLARLAGYIPGEIVGLYVATSGIVPLGPNGSVRCGPLWVVFLLNFILVPVYFIFATSRHKKGTLWPQVILASLAFPVWVFALGGPFKCLSWYESWIASITLAFVTVIFGFYKPKAGS